MQLVGRNFQSKHFRSLAKVPQNTAPNNLCAHEITTPLIVHNLTNETGYFLLE